MHLEPTYKTLAKYNEEKKLKIKASVNQSVFGLIGYIYNNFTSNPEDKKFVVKYCFFIH